MKILDGKQTAQAIYDRIKESISRGIGDIGRPPRLDMILVGENFGSEKYVKMKQKRAEEVGIKSIIHRLPEDVTQRQLEDKIIELNLYEDVDGFMIQLPLPPHLDQNSALEKIKPSKDVDGLSPVNLGLLFGGDKHAIASATPMGIMLLLKEYEIDVAGKNVVIVGRSSVVGMPLAALMNQADATVTIAHSKTKKLDEICKRADILVSATGKAGLITEGWVGKGAVVIDVGINMDEGGKVCGDVDRPAVETDAGYLSPVPGGVGPMTIAALMHNCYEIWAKRNSK